MLLLKVINPLVTNGFSHPYHLDESTSIFRGIRSKFSFLFHFSVKIMLANRIAPDGTPRFVASHLGLFGLPMSHKKDARLLWVKQTLYVTLEDDIHFMFSFLLYNAFLCKYIEDIQIFC